MNKRLIIPAFLSCLLPLGAVNAAIIVNDHSYSSIDYGTSWDTPPQNLDQVLSALTPSDDIHLTLINGFVDGTESWFGTGAFTTIIEEIAAYANATTFGWYDVANPSNYGVLFSGLDGPGASATAAFDDVVHFGFFIDPNGVQGDRLYTQSHLNPSGNFQVAIFAIDELPGQYILGWEDLALSGNSDRDYQDMIIRFTLTSAPDDPQSIPEPGTLLLMMLGLTGLAAAYRRRNVTGPQDLTLAAV